MSCFVGIICMNIHSEFRIFDELMFKTKSCAYVHMNQQNILKCDINIPI